MEFGYYRLFVLSCEFPCWSNAALRRSVRDRHMRFTFVCLKTCAVTKMEVEEEELQEEAVEEVDARV